MGNVVELNKSQFIEVIKRSLDEDKWDWSAVSESEWDRLFNAYMSGANIEDMVCSILDGSVYGRYFDVESQRSLH